MSQKSCQTLSSESTSPHQTCTQFTWVCPATKHDALSTMVVHSSSGNLSPWTVQFHQSQWQTDKRLHLMDWMGSIGKIITQTSWSTANFKPSKLLLSHQYPILSDISLKRGREANACYCMSSMLQKRLKPTEPVVIFPWVAQRATMVKPLWLLSAMWHEHNGLTCHTHHVHGMNKWRWGLAHQVPGTCSLPWFCYQGSKNVDTKWDS